MPTLPEGPGLAELQRAFTSAVLAGGEGVARHIVDGVLPGGERLSVHRNNSQILLREALADTYGAVRRLVGDDFFAGTARAFIAAHPPASPVLAEWGAHFAEFLGSFGPAGEHGYLADVARLEWTVNEAERAPDADGCGPGDFDDLTAAAMAALVLRLHPSVRLLASRVPQLSIWRANQPGADEPGRLIDLDAGGENVLVLRAGLAVQVRELSDGAFAFIDAVQAGGNLTAAVVAALEIEPGFDSRAVLAGLLGDGAIIGFETT